MDAIANVEMAQAWDGEEGDQWTEHAARFEATGVYIRERFLKEVPIAASDSVLDVGCGTGESTRDAARLASDGNVLGIDLSSRMLEFARQRCQAEGLTNVEFVQADAQVHPFEPARFDLTISSFGVMFFNDPVAAFSNIRGALRPRGRLAVLAWQSLEKNEWLTALREALAMGRDLPAPPLGAPGPFGLADAAHVRDVLASAGFEAVDLVPVEENVRLGDDADDAWAFLSVLGMVKGLSEGLDDDARAQAHDNLRQAVKAHETPEGVLFGSAAWLITARRA